MRLPPICLLVFILSSPVHATDIGWTRIDVPTWKGKGAGDGHYDLSDGLVQADIPLGPMEGKWIRITGTAPASAANFSAWVTVFNAANKVISRNLPTACRILGKQKRCENVAWVKPGGARLRLSYYSDFEPVIVEPGLIEWTEGSSPASATLVRYAKVRKHIKENYYLSSEVDWAPMHPEELASLRAPAGVDPIPYAVQELVAKLPGNKHTGIVANALAASAPDPLVLPSCERLEDATWKLNVPSTPGRHTDHQRYLRAAHACLARAPGQRWLVNLTEHGGGNANLTLAALAPVLGAGDLLSYTAPSGARFVVRLTADRVTLAGKTVQRLGPRTPAVTGPVTFVIGNACASACEALAIAVKGRFKIVGQRTAGFTTANSSVHLNTHLTLALTEGTMVDRSGKPVEFVEPDEVLDEKQTAALLGIAPT